MSFEKRPKFKWLQERVGYEGDDCLFPPFRASQGGYHYFMVDYEVMSAHRWMCEQVNGPPPTPAHHAAHSCGRGDQGCVNPRHLSWKTNSQNQLDRRAHGTAKGGSGNRWKLTPAQVAEIRALKDREPVKSLADRFGIKDATVRQIHSYKIWRTGQYESGANAKAAKRAASNFD